MLRTRPGHRAPVTDAVKAVLDRGGDYRASGQCACSICNQAYWRHCSLEAPYDFLVLLCNGDVVKL